MQCIAISSAANPPDTCNVRRSAYSLNSLARQGHHCTASSTLLTTCSDFAAHASAPQFSQLRSRSQCGKAAGQRGRTCGHIQKRGSVLAARGQTCCCCCWHSWSGCAIHLPPKRHTPHRSAAAPERHQQPRAAPASTGAGASAVLSCCSEFCALAERRRSRQQPCSARSQKPPAARQKRCSRHLRTVGASRCQMPRRSTQSTRRSRRR